MILANWGTEPNKRTYLKNTNYFEKYFNKSVGINKNEIKTFDIFERRKEGCHIRLPDLRKILQFNQCIYRLDIFIAHLLKCSNEYFASSW